MTTTTSSKSSSSGGSSSSNNSSSGGGSSGCHSGSYCHTVHPFEMILPAKSVLKIAGLLSSSFKKLYSSITGKVVLTSSGAVWCVIRFASILLCHSHRMNHS